MSDFKLLLIVILALLSNSVIGTENCDKEDRVVDDRTTENCSINPRKGVYLSDSKCPILVQSNLLGISPTTNFPSVATRKVMGRLGNHLWAVMMTMAMSIKLNLNMVLFEETKDYARKYFKGFDECPSLEDDYCGFKDFYEHFRTFLDLKIEQFYSEKSGHKVKFERLGIQLSVPAEYALRWKLDYKELVDTQHFIDDFKPSKFKTPGRNFCSTNLNKNIKK